MMRKNKKRAPKSIKSKVGKQSACAPVFPVFADVVYAVRVTPRVDGTPFFARSWYLTSHDDPMLIPRINAQASLYLIAVLNASLDGMPELDGRRLTVEVERFLFKIPPDPIA